MSGWVLDCSMALAWGLPDERSREADRFFRRHVTDEHRVWVPALWWYELANALATAARRRRITAAQSTLLAGLLGELPLRTDALIGRETFARQASLAAELELSAYDAAYLELAERRGFALATLDQQLAAVAHERGVEVWRVRRRK